MLYEYFCPACGEYHDLVRPLGADVDCAACGKPMRRSVINHFQVVGPTVNTLGMASEFHEAMQEREHAFQKVEARIGEPLPRPNDWARPKAEAAEMARRGEIDTKQFARDTESEILQGVTL